MAKPRLVIGISGASGIIYGVRLLAALKSLPVETHLVISKAALQTLSYETELSITALREMASYCHDSHDIAAPIASGSFKTLGMIVAPCSMRTLAEIATGMTTSLLTRAADVVLKERRRLVLMTRESPLHLVHLENMVKITQMGGIIAPPVPAFYAKPQNLDEMVHHSVGKVLDLFGFDINIKRWKEA